MSFNCHPKYERQQQHLERSWDPQVTQPGPPPQAWKSNTSPDLDLKELVINKRLPAVHSAKALPTRTTINSTCSSTPSSFNSIAATFGFSHHIGTDKTLELDVLKAILRRESALANLHDTCTPKYSNKIFLQNDSGTGVLDQLTSIRDVTVNLIEAVTTWRQSMLNADPDIPRPFMYENQNYLLKIIFDMDFLANITPLVEALGLDGSKLHSNPLMMPESLDKANLGKIPEESAREDANGDTNSKLYLERLKLRTVEQTLLREMNFNRKGAPSVAWGEDEKPDLDGGNTTFQDSTTLMNSSSVNTDNDTKARQADILSWYRQAQLQLMKLEEGIGEKLSADFNSTYRLKIPVPEVDPLIKMSYSPSRMMPPTTLYEHHSTVADVPLPGPRSRSPSPTRTGASGGIRKLKRLPNQQNGSHLTIASLSPSLEWMRSDIELLMELEEAPRCVALACASTLILLASGPQIPKNISWETFCKHANEAPIEKDMNAVAPSLIPQFKIRAISPFLGSLTETFEEDMKSEDAETKLEEGHPRTEAIRKLVTWIMEVLKIATTSSPDQGAPVARVSASQSTIETIKSRRLESNNGLKRKQALERSKCPADMKVKHTEVSENELLAGATITISLEIQKKKPTPTNPKRFVIKVFDENTLQYAQVAVNCKEYSSYLLDLREVFPNEELELYFEPNSSKWWAKYLKEVSTVSVNQGVLSVRVSKKAIRSLISNQIKSKDAVEDSDLVSQDDEMASQQPLNKEKSVEKKKKKPSAKAKREEAAAAAAKAKELEAKKKKEQDEKTKAEKAENAKKKKAAAEAAAKKVADEEAANKKQAEDEEAKVAKLKAEEDMDMAAAKQRDMENAEKEAADALAKKKSEKEEESSSKAKGEEEEDDGYDDEYDAEYDDENFVMTPIKGSPNNSQRMTTPVLEKKQEEEKQEDKVEPAKDDEKKAEEGEEEDAYGDEYDDDNYDDESTTKTPQKPNETKPQEKKKEEKKETVDEEEDYAMSDDEYEALFDEE